MTTATEKTVQYKKSDFVSDQEIRWCPGCGDYAVLNAVQQVFAELGVPREKFVIVSGIGCSSRFPYYVETYGFHGIHGRAMAIATGIRVVNPELDVWVATGDGDALAIGGNHMIHTARRNVGLKVLMFNNRIYGLTKGQYSPTSVKGQKTTSTPFGTVDNPFNPVALALGSGATFVARAVDTQLKHMAGVLRAAHEHRGFAFVEILQNCVIFNDGAYEHLTEKTIRDDRQVDLRPGQPLVFGKKLDKGLRITPDSIELCKPEEATVWNPQEPSGANAYRLAQVGEQGALPVPVGIFRAAQAPAFEDDVYEQMRAATAKLGEGTLQELLAGGETWTVS